MSKQGFVFVFDRVNGRPIWPIEERPVPQSTVPGEKTSPTQPFPTKPAPFDRQGVTENDVIDFTPELRKEALAVLAKYNYGPLYTPPSLEKPTIQMPGYRRRRQLVGSGVRPGNGDHVRHIDHQSLVVTLANRPEQSPAPTTSERQAPWRRCRACRSGSHRMGASPRSISTLASIGWMVPMGDLDHPRVEAARSCPLGRPTRGHTLLTKTL